MSHRFRENILNLWDVPRHAKPKNLNITEKQCPNQVNLLKHHQPYLVLFTLMIGLNRSFLITCLKHFANILVPT